MKDWNRKDNWEVRKTFHEVYYLSVIVGLKGSRKNNLSILRKIFNFLDQLPPMEVVKKIDDSGRIEIGEMPGKEFRRVCNKLSGHKIAFEAKNVSYISYLPINNSNNTAWLIEDREEAEIVAKQIIAAGAKVVEVQA